LVPDKGRGGGKRRDGGNSRKVLKPKGGICSTVGALLSCEQRRRSRGRRDSGGPSKGGLGHHKNCRRRTNVTCTIGGGKRGTRREGAGKLRDIMHLRSPRCPNSWEELSGGKEANSGNGRGDKIGFTRQIPKSLWGNGRE